MPSSRAIESLEPRRLLSGATCSALPISSLPARGAEPCPIVTLDSAAKVDRALFRSDAAAGDAVLAPCEALNRFDSPMRPVNLDLFAPGDVATREHRDPGSDDAATQGSPAIPTTTYLTPGDGHCPWVGRCVTTTWPADPAVNGSHAHHRMAHNRAHHLLVRSDAPPADAMPPDGSDGSGSSAPRNADGAPPSNAPPTAQAAAQRPPALVGSGNQGSRADAVRDGLPHHANDAGSPLPYVWIPRAPSVTSAFDAGTGSLVRGIAQEVYLATGAPVASRIIPSESSVLTLLSSPTFAETAAFSATATPRVEGAAVAQWFGAAEHELSEFAARLLASASIGSHSASGDSANAALPDVGAWAGPSAVFLGLAPVRSTAMGVARHFWRTTAVASFVVTMLGYWYCTIHAPAEPDKRVVKRRRQTRMLPTQKRRGV